MNEKKEDYDPIVKDYIWSLSSSIFNTKYRSFSIARLAYSADLIYIDYILWKAPVNYR